MWQVVSRSRQAGSMALRRSVGRVLPESEQIDAHACVLKKLFTGIGQCTGKDNKLNLCLKHHKIDLSGIGTSKGDRCFKLAAHLVRNKISIDDMDK